MALKTRVATIVLISLIFALPLASRGDVRTSVGLVGGIGLPIGWWGERWDVFQSGELHLRYEFARGTGILLHAGLGKAYFTSMTPEEVAADSRAWDTDPRFNPKIIEAYQGGSFKQIPLGFGFYNERLLLSSRAIRGYGSMSMVVYLWKFERSQAYYQESPGLKGEIIPFPDPWWGDQDGSDLGAQLTLGVLIPIRKLIFLDVSAAYHYLNIGRDHGAVAYWGEPARTWDDDRLDEAKGRADFLQLRVGIHYGK